MVINKQVLVHDLGDMVELHNLNMNGFYRQVTKLERKFVLMGVVLAIAAIAVDKKFQKLEKRIAENSKQDASTKNDIYREIDELHGEIASLKKTN